MRLFRNKTKEWYHVFVAGEEIVCTAEHPFFVVGRGFIPARLLKVSDNLLQSDGEEVIIEEIKIESLDEATTTYNFKVADYHTYYVAENKILVHNMCPSAENGIDEYKSISDGTHRAVINPGETEAPHAHIFKKARNIGRIFSNGKIDNSLLNDRDAMRFVKDNKQEILNLISKFYGKR